MNKSQIIQSLYEIEAIKLGSFTLKSGAISPIYIDLRQIISYPAVLQSVSHMIWDKVKHLPVELLCGVPYTALPIATCIALQFNKPMLIARKEAKAYGTKKQIEGRYQPGQPCLIIEDVITSGSSVLTTLADLKAAGLTIPYAAAFLDRQQNGKQAINEAGCEFFSVFTLAEVLAELKQLGITLPPELMA